MHSPSMPNGRRKHIFASLLSANIEGENLELVWVVKLWSDLGSHCPQTPFRNPLKLQRQPRFVGRRPAKACRHIERSSRFIHYSPSFLENVHSQHEQRPDFPGPAHWGHRRSLLCPFYVWIRDLLSPMVRAVFKKQAASYLSYPHTLWPALQRSSFIILNQSVNQGVQKQGSLCPQSWKGKHGVPGTINVMLPLILDYLCNWPHAWQ